MTIYNIKKIYDLRRLLFCLQLQVIGPFAHIFPRTIIRINLCTKALEYLYRRNTKLDPIEGQETEVDKLRRFE